MLNSLNMSRLLRPLTLLLAAMMPHVAHAQANAPIIGRWDLTVQGTDRTFPSWLEVTLSGNRTLVGRFVASGGSARPIARVTYENNTMRFAIPPQWEAGNDDLRVEANFENDRLQGTMIMPNGTRHTFSGARAPVLRRAAPPSWDKEVVLFDGKSMDAWEALPGGRSQWQVLNGILTNVRSGANLATKQKYNDFKLHIEFRYAKGGNSGVYLRGRHEVQVEDNGNLEPSSVHIGGVYGFLVASENASRGPGEWQTYDITLIGRRVTVVLNGQTVIADQTIPGITGGALDSNEGEPGPIYLQGDHTAVEYRNIRITPARMP
ncbi:MAG: DUF1080 domain-containing protein [Gemmatimonadaceae bacterium]|nr:DUF1080 domain-containing protein [Gemmatimonadaceae bacterium]